MKHYYILLSLFFLLITGCSQIKVDTVYDPSISFSHLRTYSWADIDMPEDRLESYPDVKKMVHHAVDLVMRIKGFELRESGDVDFKVATYAGVQQAMQLTRSGRVQDTSWLGPAGRYDYTRTGKATLFIDIFDGRDGKLIWRGDGVGFVENFSMGKKMREGIDTWVAYILKSFPPS